MPRIKYTKVREQKLRRLAKARLLLFIHIVVGILALMLLISVFVQMKEKPKVAQHDQQRIVSGISQVFSSYMKVKPKNESIAIEPTEVIIVTEPVFKPQQEPEPQPVQQTKSFNSNDTYLLAKIAMAEAEGESTKCKALVILTVLNRVASDKFPSNIHDVIFQQEQFSPTYDGRWNKVEPSEDCYKALQLVCSGYDESQGCLYFEASRNNWVSRNRQLLFEVDKTRFYK